MTAERDSRKTGKFKKVCVTDPDAIDGDQWSQPAARAGYKQHGAVDDACGVVLDVEVIHGDVTILGWRDWSRRNRRARLDLDRGPHFDRSFMAIRAAVDGLGVCLDSMLLAEQELRAGNLVVVLKETAMKVRGHGFVTLRSKADTLKVAAFREWLLGRAGANQGMVGGKRGGRHD